MHIAAASPRYLERHEVKSQEVQQEKEIAENKLREQGKSPEVIEKALIGALNRYYSEVCLLDQGFVKEQKQTIRNLVESTGGGVKLTGFQRFHLGEGIEVVKSNFADDVAAQLKS